MGVGVQNWINLYQCNQSFQNYILRLSYCFRSTKIYRINPVEFLSKRKTIDIKREIFFSLSLFHNHLRNPIPCIIARVERSLTPRWNPRPSNNQRSFAKILCQTIAKFRGRHRRYKSRWKRVPRFSYGAK